MAEETTKVVILSVELDISQFSKNADEAVLAIDEIQKKQAVLQVQGKQNTQEYAALSAQLQKTRKDLRDNAAAVQTVSKLQKENTGSIKEMRQELSVATLRWNNLSKAERDNINVGGKLKTQIKGLSDELKKNESAIGDNRRNVGNYQQAIQGALSQVNLFGGGLGQLGSILSSGGIFGAALLGAVGGAKLLSEAFLSIEENADRLERSMAASSAAFDVFKGSVGQAISEGSLSATAKAFTNFARDWNIFMAQLVGQGDAAKAAAAEAERLAGAMQRLNDVEREASTVISANNVLIDQYIARSKNRTLSDEERLGILEEASELEKQNLETLIDAEEDRLKIIRAQNELKIKAGVLTDEDEQREIDSINKINGFRQDSLALQERINNRQDQILDARQKRQEAADAKEIAAAEKKQKQLQRIAQSLFVDDYKNLLDDRKASTDLFISEEELVIKNAYANREIDEKEFNRQMLQLKIKAAEAQLDLLIENSSTEIGTENEIAAKKIEIQKLMAELIILINKQVDDSDKDLLELKKQRANALLDLTAQTLSSISQIQRNNTEEEIENISEAEKRQLDAIDKKIERRREEGKDFADLEKQRENIEKDADKRTVALQKKQFERTKRLQLAEATILGAKATIAALGTPPAPNFILAAIAAAETALEIAVISSQKFKRGGMPKAERGMIIGGKPHSQGGTKFIGSDGSKFEAEKDEAMIILNKRATEKLRYYSSLNYNSGGVDFYKGNTSSSYLQDGGFAARAATQPVLDEVNSRQSFADFPPIFVLVEDINSAQGQQAKVKSRSVFP